MNKTIITTSFSETRTLGEKLAKQFVGGEVVALYGDLGSGKTTFVQGLAKGLGIEKRIISPTFIIMRTYELNEQKKLYHVDLYRIERESDVEGLGLLELMNDPENIVIIEWPEKIENLLPTSRTDILFTYIDDNKRKIEMK